MMFSWLFNSSRLAVKDLESRKEVSRKERQRVKAKAKALDQKEAATNVAVSTSYGIALYVLRKTPKKEKAKEAVKVGRLLHLDIGTTGTLG